MAHVRYRGFTDKNAIFLQLHCLAIPRGHLATKKTRQNIEKWPWNLGVMLEFRYYLFIHKP